MISVSINTTLRFYYLNNNPNTMWTAYDIKYNLSRHLAI